MTFLSCPRINLLTVLAPSVNPSTLTTSECISGDSKELTNRGCTPCMKSLSVDIIGHIESRSLFDDVERTAIPLQLTLTGADGLDLFAVLIVDIVPVLRCLNMADALCLQTNYRQKQSHDY